jgi:hypothetical protein
MPSQVIELCAHPRNASRFFLRSHGIKVLLLAQHGPDGPSCFIGHGDQDDIGRSPCQ